jgi:hypothetical protein
VHGAHIDEEFDFRFWILDFGLNSNSAIQNTNASHFSKGRPAWPSNRGQGVGDPWRSKGYRFPEPLASNPWSIRAIPKQSTRELARDRYDNSNFLDAPI